MAGQLTRVVEAPRGHAYEDLLNWLVVGARVDAISAAKLLGHLELAFVEIHANDTACASNLRRLHDGEANGAKAKDRDGAAGFDLGIVPHGAPSGGHAAPEQANLFERSLWHDLGAGNFGEHGVLRHGGATHEVVDRLAVWGAEPRSAVWHHALALCAADLRAQVGLRGLAEDAARLTALGRVARHDMVANRDGGNTLANALDDGAGLVAQNAWEEAFRVVAIESVNVSVAQRVRDDLDTNLARLRRRDDNVFDGERLLRFPCDGGFAGDCNATVNTALVAGKGARRPKNERTERVSSVPAALATFQLFGMASSGPQKGRQIAKWQP
eukprot:COSAG02_NODE_481_length_21461_cov_43.885597_4_plen_327_part_00